MTDTMTPQHILVGAFFVLAVMPIAAQCASPSGRHILVFVIDDLGFADVGYKHTTYPNISLGMKFPTPTIDELAMGGVRLESYYTVQLCSPSRTSLLSGRYAYTIGMDATVIQDGFPDQMPLELKTVAEHLSEAGWATSAYGKWDAGMTSWGCTPTCRGFDHFHGFYNAYNDYFTHRVGPGLDLRDDFEPATAHGNWTGHYYTDMVGPQVIDWISDTIKANASRSTFAYVAHEAIHAPDEVPLHYINTSPCAQGVSLEHPTRRIACGMMVAVDESIANVTAAYKALGIWEQTTVVFVADNGGNPQTGGNNWPLRGMKATSFEGGVRGTAFVSGAGLQAGVQGSVNRELLSVADWLPTFVEGIAGLPITPQSLKRPGMPAPPPLDGVNQWPTIATGAKSARDEILLQLDGGCRGDCAVPGQGAIRVGKWKLLHGYVVVWATKGPTDGNLCTARTGQNIPGSLPITPATSPPWCPTGWVPPPSSGRLPIPAPEAFAHCNGQLPCNVTGTPLGNGLTMLFDIEADPYEQHDLAAQRPDIVAMLMAKLQGYNDTHIPQQDPAARDPSSNPARFGGIWTPWRGDPDPSKCSTSITAGPGADMRSHFDAVAYDGSKGTLLVTGWCWDPRGPAEGRTPLQSSVTEGGSVLAAGLANLFRPHLVNATGAPNGYHGFALTVNATETAKVAHGKHAFEATCHVMNVTVSLSGGPLCLCDLKACSCDGDGDGGVLEEASHGAVAGSSTMCVPGGPAVVADSRFAAWPPCDPRAVTHADLWL